ncbi:MAG TPA: DUF998 domain-containing protein [Vicinamibacterales bacterium]|nr:DUF998 domain-containing protein [Vicinamibacterales bacterium]
MLKELKEGRPVILETHPHYRTAIGVLGASLPVILIGASLTGFLEPPELQSSISAYYWTAMRDWFVGTLFVIGVFLFFYTYTPHRHGSEARTKYDAVRKGKADAWLGKIAGIAAILVALLPTNPPPSTVQPPTIGMLHGVAAGILFTCLALFPLLLFSQSKKKGRVYQMYGWAMLATLASIVMYQFAPESLRNALAPGKPVLFLETFLIFVFGKSWFDKGRELAQPETDPAKIKTRPMIQPAS